MMTRVPGCTAGRCLRISADLVPFKIACAKRGRIDSSSALSLLVHARKTFLVDGGEELR